MESLSISQGVLLERRRIQEHLTGAELGARRRGPALDPVRAWNRALLLDELGRYRRAGRFPRNREFRNKLVPYFVDSEGTRCALAHLLEIGGQAQLVSDVAARRNNARVRELASHAELIHWLECAGLTLEEAARIQPSYCTTSYADECFCQPGTRNDANVAVATVLGVENSETLRVRIERIEGPATSVTAGDEISAHGIASIGEQIILRGVRSGDAGIVKLARIDLMWSVSDSSVTCNASHFAQTHPVPIDAALTALRSTYPDCKAVLAAQDFRWQATPPCDENGCACGLVAGYANGPALTSVAVLSALLLYRRRRRERKLVSSSSRSPQR